MKLTKAEQEEILRKRREENERRERAAHWDRCPRCDGQGKRYDYEGDRVRCDVCHGTGGQLWPEYVELREAQRAAAKLPAAKEAYEARVAKSKKGLK